MKSGWHVEWDARLRRLPELAGFAADGGVDLSGLAHALWRAAAFQRVTTLPPEIEITIVAGGQK
jgi:hypothetical protein